MKLGTLFKKKVTLVTHDQGFHADDVMAYAILQEVLEKRGNRWCIVRTRDENIISKGDIIFDVGNDYKPDRNLYDHHQQERAGARDNGVLYASAGLIWKHFGRELCVSDEMWQSIDRCLIQELDAIDNGQNYIGTMMFPDTGYTSLAIHISNFESKDKTPRQLLRSFKNAAVFARGILHRMIESKIILENSFKEASKVYELSENKQILVFEKNYERPTWKRLAEFPEPIFVVYYNEKADSWKVEAVPVTPITMDSRKLFPETWRGLRDNELVEATGVSDAQFCHPSGFLLGTKTKESALRLARKAVENT